MNNKTNKTIKRLIKEIKPIFDNDTATFAASFEENAKLLLQFLDIPNEDINGLNQVVEQAMLALLLPNETEEQVPHYAFLATKVEPFLKKILYYKNKQTYLNFKNNRTQQGGTMRYYTVLNMLKQRANGSHLHKYVKEIRIDRNAVAHEARSYNSSQMLYHRNDVLVTYLLAIADNYLLLKNVVQQSEEKEFTEYLKSVKEDFEDWKNKFVHIDGREFDFFEAEAEETDVFEQKITGSIRRGTIEHLMLHKVPEKRMMIWGKAGTGKTTTFQHLAYKEAVKRLEKKLYVPIPIYLELIQSDNRYSMEERIAKKLDTTKITAVQMLKEGRLRLFLDGLNEVRNEKNTGLPKKVRTEIKALSDNYPKTFMLISSRPTEDKEFKDIPIFRLLPMSDEKITTFLNKNCNNKAARRIIETEIAADKRLKGIIRTPLLLARLITVVSKNGKMPPKSEGMIIGQFLKCLLKRERHQQSVSFLNFKEVHRLLKHLGHDTLEIYEANIFSEDDIMGIWLPIIEEFKMDIKPYELLQTLQELHILQYKEEKEEYAFAHQAYQDYYHSAYNPRRYKSS